MKRLLFLLALMVTIWMIAPLHSADAASASPRILFTVRSVPATAPTLTPDGMLAPSRAVTLMAMTEQGNSTAISPLLVDGDELYVSPDRTKIASRRIDNWSHDFVVLDEHGTLLSVYSFEQHNQGSAQEWYLWGWRGNSAVVLARFHDDKMTFYDYDLTTQSQMPSPSQTLNDFSKWSISEIRWAFYNYLCICDVFQFSPSFRYVKTPASLSDEINPGPSSAFSLQDQPMIWDLQTKSTTVFNGNLVWYGTHVAWSPTEDRVVFPMWNHMGTRLYSYDLKTQLKLFASLGCAVADSCEVYDLTWDPRGRLLAFWQFPNRHLVVVDADTLQQKILLAPESDEELSGFGITWSPDSSVIALGETGKKPGWPTIGDSIRIIDAHDGHLVRSYPVTDMDALVGYLAS